jgi:hypothetical protein
MRFLVGLCGDDVFFFFFYVCEEGGDVAGEIRL